MNSNENYIFDKNNINQNKDSNIDFSPISNIKYLHQNFESKTKNSTFETLNTGNSNNKKVSNFPKKNLNNNYKIEIGNEDIKKINLLIQKIRENNKENLNSLEEIKNKKEKELNKLKNQEFSNSKKINVQRLEIKDLLDFDNDNLENNDNNKESIFNKLVNLTNINYNETSITENNISHSYNKYKYNKNLSNRKKYDKEITFNDINNNLNTLNENSKRNISFSENKKSNFDNNNKLDNNNYIKNYKLNQISFPNSNRNDYKFDFDKKIISKEKKKSDKFYEKAEIKNDYFSLRKINDNHKDLTNQNLIFDNFKNDNERNNDIKSKLNENLSTLNLRENEYSFNNFIMPVNPMNDVLYAKVNYLYGSKNQ